MNTADRPRLARIVEPGRKWSYAQWDRLATSLGIAVMATLATLVVLLAVELIAFVVGVELPTLVRTLTTLGFLLWGFVGWMVRLQRRGYL